MTEHADQETEHHLREAIRHLSEAQDGELRKTHDVAIERVLTTVSTVLREHSQDE